jgi:dihydrofolate reductase
MRKVCYSVAMSLDGFIAGSNGEYDWIAMDLDIDFAAFTARIDTLLAGRKPWRVMQGAGGMPGVKTYGFSKTLASGDCEDAVLSDSPVDTIDALKAESGKDIWQFGGGELFRSLLNNGLLDSIEVAVIRVLLGDGVPLLPSPGPRAPVKLVRQRLYEKTGIVLLNYEFVSGTSGSS